MSQEFYIIVKKDTNGTLSIVDTESDIEAANNYISSNSSGVPNTIITADNPQQDVYFYVKVEKDNTTQPQISVGTNKYNLILDKQYPLSNDKSNLVKDGTSYNTMANDASMKGGQKQVDMHLEVDGGQKEKQKNHNKRSYSKKNRKSRSKSDTLRNYFNYNAIETM